MTCPHRHIASLERHDPDHLRGAAARCMACKEPLWVRQHRFHTHQEMLDAGFLQAARDGTQENCASMTESTAINKRFWSIDDWNRGNAVPKRSGLSACAREPSVDNSVINNFSPRPLPEASRGTAFGGQLERLAHLERELEEAKARLRVWRDEAIRLRWALSQKQVQLGTLEQPAALTWRERLAAWWARR